MADAGAAAGAPGMTGEVGATSNVGLAELLEFSDFLSLAQDRNNKDAVHSAKKINFISYDLCFQR
jgi:hypothetical protein